MKDDSRRAARPPIRTIDAEATTTGRISPEVASAVLGATTALILVLDEQGRIVLLNHAAERATGMFSTEVLGHDFTRFLPIEEIEEARDAFSQILAGAPTAGHESRWQSKSRKRPRIAWTYVPMINDQRRMTHAIVTGVDVTLRHEAETSIARREQELGAVLATLPVGCFTAAIDLDGTFLITSANPRFAEIVGIAPDPDRPLPLTANVYDRDVPAVLDAAAALVREHGEQERQIRILRPDGEMRWVRSRVAPLLGPSGELNGAVGTITDITDEVRAHEEATGLGEVLGTTTDLVFVMAADGNVLYANPAAVETFGSTPSNVVDVMDEASRQAWTTDVRRVLLEFGTWKGEMRLIDRTGQRLPVSQLFICHRRTDGSIRRLSMLARDIREQKDFEAHLAGMAFHDALTGLPNRTVLLDQLTQSLANIEQSGETLAVMFLDLDFFKSVNDALGHDAGDELLHITADRLRAAVRPGDVVARLGGDEFVVLCCIDDAAEAMTIAERIRSTIGQPFLIKRQVVDTSTSIGVALTDHPGLTPADLLSNADAASYRAKARGRNRSELYPSPEQTLPSRFHRR